MQYTINQLREELFKPVYDVYEIFKNHFGEEHVDLQDLPDDEHMEDALNSWDCEETEFEGVWEVDNTQKEHIKDVVSCRTNIVVWWPEVKITNEHNRSTIIYDLFARVKVRMDGTIPPENRGFELNKTTYTGKQFASGYQHSHTPYSSYIGSNSPARWQQPCLGQGPINRTITTLKTDCDEMAWMLFCEELSRYVTVESLTGVPYIKLESIGSTQSKDYVFGKYDGHTPSLLKFGSFKNYVKDFVIYYLQHGHLAVNYCIDSFVVGMNYYDYIVDVSNCFIEWFNKHGNQEILQEFNAKGVLLPRLVDKGEFKQPSTATPADIERFNGMEWLEFKGEQKTLTIIPDEVDADNPTVTLLHHDICMFIIYNILRIINYRFTNGNNRHQGAEATTEATAPTHQTVIYI